MRAVIQAVAASAALMGVSPYANAVDIGGLNVPIGPVFAVGQIYENAVTAVGQTLSGYGEVDSISGQAVNTLCTNCELTYRFSDYVVSSITSSEVRFTGGTVNFYLGFGADNDFNVFTSGSSAADLAAATNGTLFLSLMGHAVDAAGNTFIGTGINIGTVTPSGSGSGLADVNTATAGIANAFFDTNAVPAVFGGPADFLLTSSFSGLFPPHPGECTQGQGPSCISGSADFRGNVVANIPEPETYALMLAGLGVVGFVARRRRKT